MAEKIYLGSEVINNRSKSGVVFRQSQSESDSKNRSRSRFGVQFHD